MTKLQYHRIFCRELKAYKTTLAVAVFGRRDVPCPRSLGRPTLRQRDGVDHLGTAIVVLGYIRPAIQIRGKFPRVKTVLYQFSH